MIHLELFIAFLQIGLFSFGGGYAALPFIEQQTVEVNHWLTMNEYLDLVAISGMTPGPIALNASTFVGMKLAGVTGAIAATAGCVLPSCVIMSIIAWCLAKYGNADAMKRVMTGLRPASAGLIAAAGLSIAITALGANTERGIAGTDPFSAMLFAAGVFALRAKKRGQIAVIAGCGLMALAVEAVRRLFF